MIETFLMKFGAELEYNKIGNKYYLASDELIKLSKSISRQPELIGLFLGEEKDGKFSPSLPLLSIINGTKEKVIIKDIGENDFLYGKNLRARHIIKMEGTLKEGFLKIVVNERDECLGMAKVKKIDGSDVSLRNVIDVGDYLRRERK